MIKTSVCLVLNSLKVCALMLSWNQVVVESIGDFRPGSIDRISGRMLYSADFQLSPNSFKTFRVLFFCPKYIRQTLATF